jgi:hypothetical protein
VRVRANAKGQVLDGADTVSETDGELGPDKVGGLDEAVLIHFAAKEDELTETDGRRLAKGILLDELQWTVSYGSTPM